MGWIGQFFTHTQFSNFCAHAEQRMHGSYCSKNNNEISNFEIKKRNWCTHTTIDKNEIFQKNLQNHFYCIYFLFYFLHKLNVGFDHKLITMKEIRAMGRKIA